MSQFTIETHKAVKKDLRKISSQAAKRILNETLPKIATNPFIGIPLVGVLRGYFKFVLHLQGISYRIIYQIDNDQKVIFIIAIGTREKFYERLLRRIK